jgi:hypothetical protein
MYQNFLNLKLNRLYNSSNLKLFLLYAISRLQSTATAPFSAGDAASHERSELAKQSGLGRSGKRVFID